MVRTAWSKSDSVFSSSNGTLPVRHSSRMRPSRYTSVCTLMRASAEHLLRSAVMSSAGDSTSANLARRRGQTTVAGDFGPPAVADEQGLGSKVAVHQRRAVVIAGDVGVVHAGRSIRRDANRDRQGQLPLRFEQPAQDSALAYSTTRASPCGCAESP